MDRLLVKHRLLDQGMTLAKLAVQIGVSYDRLIKIVNGYRESRPEELRQIASALGIEPEDLTQPSNAPPRTL